MKSVILDVTQYGVNRQTQEVQTAVIQRVIDECGRAGGGTVYFPPGDFISGTLFLKNNVTLHLEAGATLRGSTDMKDYDAAAQCLVYAKNVERISITGRGMIHGNGHSFWTDERVEYKQNTYLPKESRPRALVYFVGCRNVTVKDITLRDSPSYTLWPLGCENVCIDRITIDNDRRGPNTDGIDIDCSSNVRVSNCHITAGDVSVTWEGARGPWQSALRFEDVRDLEIAGFKGGHAPSAPGAPAILLSNVNAARIRGSSISPGIKTFLALRGSSTRDVSLLSNDLHTAETAWSQGPEVPADVLIEAGNFLPRRHGG